MGAFQSIRNSPEDFYLSFSINNKYIFYFLSLNLWQFLFNLIRLVILGLSAHAGNSHRTNFFEYLFGMTEALDTFEKFFFGYAWNPLKIPDFQENLQLQSQKNQYQLIQNERLTLFYFWKPFSNIWFFSMICLLIRESHYQHGLLIYLLVIETWFFKAE